MFAEHAVDPPHLQPAAPRRLARRGATDECCPFIDAGDHRCAAAFTLHGLDRAFDYCLRQPLACPTFYRIAADRRATAGSAFGRLAAADPGQGLVPLTLLGQPLHHPAPAPAAAPGPVANLRDPAPLRRVA